MTGLIAYVVSRFLFGLLIVLFAVFTFAPLFMDLDRFKDHRQR